MTNRDKAQIKSMIHLIESIRFDIEQFQQLCMSTGWRFGEELCEGQYETLLAIKHELERK